MQLYWQLQALSQSVATLQRGYKGGNNMQQKRHVLTDSMVYSILTLLNQKACAYLLGHHSSIGAVSSWTNPNSVELLGQWKHYL